MPSEYPRGIGAQASLRMPLYFSDILGSPSLLRFDHIAKAVIMGGIAQWHD
jgi:hypothetical protein